MGLIGPANLQCYWCCSFEVFVVNDRFFFLLLLRQSSGMNHLHKRGYEIKKKRRLRRAFFRFQLYFWFSFSEKRHIFMIKQELDLFVGRRRKMPPHLLQPNMDPPDSFALSHCGDFPASNTPVSVYVFSCGQAESRNIRRFDSRCPRQ